MQTLCLKATNKRKLCSLCLWFNVIIAAILLCILLTKKMSLGRKLKQKTHKEQVFLLSHFEGEMEIFAVIYLKHYQLWVSYGHILVSVWNLICELHVFIYIYIISHRLYMNSMFYIYYITYILCVNYIITLWVEKNLNNFLIVNGFICRILWEN